MVKLCKDCKHYIEQGGPATDRCSRRTLSNTLALVRGDGATIYGFCDESRAENHCGKEARWFAPKESA